jgi:hypothetical protein
MKKFIVYILAVLYLGLSTGATFQLHFCMGKLVSSSLWSVQKTDRCNKCGMAKNNGKNKCCKDEHKTIIVKQDQTTQKTAYQPVQLLATVLVPSVVDALVIPVIDLSIVQPHSKSPPDHQVPLYIHNCSFLI